MKALQLGAIMLACVASYTLSTVATTQSLDSESVEVDALECWRGISQGAVTVGEIFTMTVTCRVIETENVSVVPNESNLEPATIDLSPFEVLDGERFDDVYDPPWRVFQYSYRLRIIEEDLFGKDLNLPVVELPYHIERRLEGLSALPGRELRYVLPAEPIRIISLVPENSDDIRALPAPNFQDADSQFFRSNLILLFSATLAVISLGFALISVTRAWNAWQDTSPRSEKWLPVSAVASQVLNELKSLQRNSRENGWNKELVTRTLTALRLASATAISVPVTQQQVPLREPDRDGQLRVRRGFWNPSTIALSSSVTPAAIKETVESRNVTQSEVQASDLLLEELQQTLEAFSVVRYNPLDSIPSDEMTIELERSISAAQLLRFRTRPPIKQFLQLIESSRKWWSERWVR